MLGRTISRKYFHCGNYNMIPMQSRLDKVRIRIAGKDREKHVAKPQRALTAPNRTADEGWKRRTHTFSALRYQSPPTLHFFPYLHSSCSRSCNDRYNYFTKFIIFNKNNLTYKLEWEYSYYFCKGENCLKKWQSLTWNVWKTRSIVLVD